MSTVETGPASRGPDSVRIMIVDDHEVVRVGLKTLLELESGFEVVAQAGTQDDAVRMASVTTPDVVLMDIRLRDGSGLDACRIIRQQCPQSRVIFLTSYSDPRTVQEALRCDANGYLLKEIDSELLIDAIRTVAAGNLLLGSSIMEQVTEQIRGHSPAVAQPDPMPLVEIERRMLSLIAEGKSNREIATELHLTDEAARGYLAGIYRKLEI